MRMHLVVLLHRIAGISQISLIFFLMDHENELTCAICVRKFSDDSTMEVSDFNYKKSSIPNTPFFPGSHSATSTAPRANPSRECAV